jgi:hypothetical protein
MVIDRFEIPNTTNEYTRLITTESRFPSVLLNWKGFTAPSPYRPLHARLRHAFADAQQALGERMVAAEIDDDRGRREQIVAIDRLLEDPTTGPADAPISVLRIRRNLLIRELADSALAFDAPLPGADAEFERALQAKQELANCVINYSADIFQPSAQGDKS